MEISRRQMLQALGLATLAPAVSARDHGPAPTKAVIVNGAAKQSVIMRRVLIPAPGATVPALLVRPAAGRFPATLSGRVLHDEQTLRRIAGQGRVLLVPLKPITSPARATAYAAYLRAHPAVSTVSEDLTPQF